MPDPYEIPPGFEPGESQIPGWAKDVDRFRVCYAITLLVAQRYDPIYCKQLYDEPSLVTNDVPLAPAKRVVVHPGEPPGS